MLFDRNTEYTKDYIYKVTGKLYDMDKVHWCLRNAPAALYEQSPSLEYLLDGMEHAYKSYCQERRKELIDFLTVRAPKELLAAFCASMLPAKTSKASALETLEHLAVPYCNSYGIPCVEITNKDLVAIEPLLSAKDDSGTYKDIPLKLIRATGMYVKFNEEWFVI